MPTRLPVEALASSGFFLAGVLELRANEGRAVLMQSRIDSLMETLTNVAVGFMVAMAGNAVILPLVFGIEVSAAANFVTAALFTIISIVRQYTLRRLFNGKTVWQAMKSAFALRWQLLNGGFWSWLVRRVVRGTHASNH